MLGWLSSKILKWGRSYNSRYDEVVSTDSLIKARDSVEMTGLRFSVMSARGGTIVQTTSYDRKTDRSDYVTHVIPDGEDVAENVGRIVSMELLRQ